MANFKKDLFISYAHIDNQPLSPEHEGWISRFHSSLNALLSMRLGKQARIWRDDKLQGNDVFADEIVAQFGETAVLVSVLTPRYLKSEWCTREVSEFCERAEASGGVVVSHKARVFKVMKTPVDTEDSLPPILREMLGYEFYAIEDGTPLELDAAYGEKFAQDYNRKVNKLAYEIAQLLQALEDAAEPSPSAPSNPVEADSAQLTGHAATVVGKDHALPVAATPVASSDGEAAAADDWRRTVYLAECSFDCRDTREKLQAELQRLGYVVLPDRQLPRDESAYAEAVTSLLARCGLSIHLIGAHVGAVADGPRHVSAGALQNELAAGRSLSDGLRRVIWLPSGTVGESPEQQAFLDTLHNDADAQAGADLIVDDIEALKRSVLATLVSLEPPADTIERDVHGDDESSADEKPMIHLVCTELDRKATVPLRKFFRARGVDVTLPAFEGDAAEVRATNHRLLSRCDTVIVFYGQGEEAWKRTVDTELKKLPIHRPDRGLPNIHTLIAQPRSGDKEDLIDMDEPNLIDLFDEVSEEALENRLGSVLQSITAEPLPA